MALKAGRVGVSPTEVDKNGHITGGGSSVTVVDNLSSTSSTDALSAKQGKVLKDLVDTKEDASKIGGFEFRVNEGTAQYRTSSTGEWQNFSSGVDGINLSTPTTQGLVIYDNKVQILEGGYQIVDGICYYNMLVKVLSTSSIATMFTAGPTPATYTNQSNTKPILNGLCSDGKILPIQVPNDGSLYALGGQTIPNVEMRILGCFKVSN